MPEIRLIAEPPLPGEPKKETDESQKQEKKPNFLKKIFRKKPENDETIPIKEEKKRKTSRAKPEEEKSPEEEERLKIIKTILTWVGVLGGVGVSLKILHKIGLLKQIQENAENTDVITAPRSPDEALQAKIDNAQIDFSLSGFDGLFHIESLTDLDHTNDPVAIHLAAANGGPAGLLNTVIYNETKKEFHPGISETVFKDISSQLNLDHTGQNELTQIWTDYLESPDPNTYDQNVILNFFQSHGANPQVVEFYRYAMDLKAQDDSPDQWQSRVEPLKSWEPKPEPTPTSKDIDNNHGKADLAAPKESSQDEKTLEVAARIFADGLRVEASALGAILEPAKEIMQSLVVNKQLPDHDDIQGWLNTAIDVGSRLVTYFKDLPENVCQIIETNVSHNVDMAQQVDDDNFFETPKEAINHLTGGGGIPMAIILGIEMGLVAINSAVYLKRSMENGRITLPPPEALRKKSVDDGVNFESWRQRGIPDGYISAGIISQPSVFGVKAGREVLIEVVAPAAEILDESGNYTESHLALTDLLGKGINPGVVRELQTKNLLIKTNETAEIENEEGKLVRVEAVSVVKASDLIALAKEVIVPGDKNLLIGEPVWYD
jgi:hypothetical protein